MFSSGVKAGGESVSSSSCKLVSDTMLVSDSITSKSFSLGCCGVGVEVEAGVRRWEEVGVMGCGGIGDSCEGDCTGERKRSESSSLGRGVVMAREVVTREEDWGGA